MPNRTFVQIAALLVGLAGAGAARAQSPGAAASAAPAPASAPAGATAVAEFEAATIKPVKDADPNRKTDRVEGRRFMVDNRTLVEFLTMAYHLDRRQVVGGPAWGTTDTYDLTAVAESDGALKENGRAMFQKLLTDRFGLVFHWEQREMPVYVLSVAKGGAKMTASDAKSGHSSGCQRQGQCSLRGEDMAHFASWLQFAVVDKPVVDKTGLAGAFDFTLKWTPDSRQYFATGGTMTAAPADDANAPPGLYQAMEEELGLKLESQKTATQVLVIDKAERPAAD